MKTVFLKFELDKPLKATTVHLRGFFAHHFPEQNLLHQYDENGRHIYRYPRIQYKINDGMPFLMGIKEGADLLLSIYNKVGFMNLNGRNYNIMGWEIILEKDVELKLFDRMIKYRFATPWLALNQKNYNKYNRINRYEKKKLLKKILVGNILSMCKELEYWIDGQIKVDVNVKPVEVAMGYIHEGLPTKYDPILQVLGFVGEFHTNFILPDFIGLGKQVAKGFGTVRA